MIQFATFMKIYYSFYYPPNGAGLLLNKSISLMLFQEKIYELLHVILLFYELLHVILLVFLYILLTYFINLIILQGRKL